RSEFMTHRILGVLVLLAILVPAVPARAANKEHQQLMADIRMLQEQSQMLQNMLASLTELLKAMGARIDQRMDQNNSALVKGFADQKLMLDTLTNEARVLREKLDDNNVRIGSVSQELDALRQAVQSRPAVTSDNPDPAAAGAGAPPTAGAAPSGAPGGQVVALSPQKMQDAALSDYAIGQFDLAIEGFQAYLKNFPKSDWADDAQLYVCRSYFLSGKPDRAVDACD